MKVCNERRRVHFVPRPMGILALGALLVVTAMMLPLSGRSLVGKLLSGASAADDDEKPKTEPGKASKGKAAPAEAEKAKNKDGEKPAKGKAPPQGKRPFPQSRPAAEFPKDVEWLNTAGPIRMRDLRGKFVLLDFWTYCCINCMHILPELKKLEHAYPNQLVVIGVHSAKFAEEKVTKNIENAILRYEIEHPVINDADHRVWDAFGAQSWPTISLIDPEGNEVGQHSGEFKFELIDAVLKKALPYYQENNLMDETPVRFNMLAEKQAPTPLRYPGKVLADEASGRLFIADSNHNRIVVTSTSGQVQEVIGSGEIGTEDGEYANASFNHPQGMALRGDTLYVCDTENHMLRKVDLAKKQVSHLAGTGVQGSGWPGLEEARDTGVVPKKWGGAPAKTHLNSPWDLWIHDGSLYIAMAGPHQIWKMPLDESFLGPYAGNGREDIVDGPLLPRNPYATGHASFAQPSGLTSDGKWIYVADSEGSSIRAVPLDPDQEVKTILGTATLPFGRLFTFGDQDGPADEARLQHCLGVAYHQGSVYVADTYNNKIKKVDAKDGTTKTIAGTGKRGKADAPAEFDEPAGLCVAGGKLYVADTNNHAIRTIDIASGEVKTLELTGLTPPAPVKVERKPAFASAKQEKLTVQSVKVENGAIQLQVKLQPPAGWKINPLANMTYWIDAVGDQGPVVRKELGKRALPEPTATFTVPVQVDGTGMDTVTVSLAYYYCQDGAEGLCKASSVVFTVPLKIGDGETSSVTLSHQIPK